MLVEQQKQETKSFIYSRNRTTNQIVSFDNNTNTIYSQFHIYKVNFTISALNKTKVYIHVQ